MNGKGRAALSCLRTNFSNVRGRLVSERALTIVEVMVAAMILVMGAFAIFKIVDAATRTSYRAEQSQVVSNLLQRELEKVKARDTADIAVSLLPSDCSVPLPEDLASRWQTEGFDGHPWVTADGDVENPVIPCEELNSQGEAGDDGSDVTVNVYRMVTWYDPDNADCVRPEEADETKQACGMRRITIGARPVDTGPGGKREYREISSDVIDVPESGGN